MSASINHSVAATDLAKIGSCENIVLNKSQGRKIKLSSASKRSIRAGNKAHNSHERNTGEFQGEDKRCFVATEIYGPEAEETRALRQYRDTQLLSRWYGRVLTRCYYALSPMMVNTIRFLPSLRAPVVRVLNSIVYYVKGGDK